MRNRSARDLAIGLLYQIMEFGMSGEIGRDKRASRHDLKVGRAGGLQSTVNETRGDAATSQRRRDFGVVERYDAGRQRVIGDRCFVAGVDLISVQGLVVADGLGHRNLESGTVLY